MILFGVLFGVLVAKLSIYLFKTSLFKSQESVTIFLFAVMLLSFSLPYTLNGNGYLSVYLCGIILGNSTLIHKKYLVHFFDVSTDVAQVIIFFLLGLLVTPVDKTSLFKSQESVTIYLFAVMLLSFSLPYTLNGNGYLSVYLCGIILGNSTLIHKKYLVHFFDVSTDVAQVIIFFLLGLLVTPVDLPRVMIPSLMIMLFLTLVARPLVSLILLAPFKSSPNQIALVSWSGLRGVASIVFAISVVLSGVQTKYNLFNLVFCIVILSISIQGTLLPWVANKLSMIDKNADVRKTFNDYQEDSDISFIKIHIDKNHPWKDLEISNLGLPRDLLIAMIVRRKTFNDYQEDSDISFIKIHIDKNHPWKDLEISNLGLPRDLLIAMIVRNHSPIVPKGNTVLEVGDLLVFAARSFEDRKHLSLREVVIDKKSKWVNTPLHQITTENPYLIILIKRNLENIIPTGDTKLLPGDILILHQITTENPYLIILIKRNLENIIPTGDTKLLPGDILIMAAAEE